MVFVFCFRQFNTFVHMDGDYHILAKIGSGGFGVVYRARHLTSGAVVAVKVISKRDKSLDQLQAIRNEVEACKTLYHSNIVRVYEVIETAMEVRIVMDFAEGKNHL